MRAVHEYVGNMHIHTPYSDGESYHAEIAQAALQAGLDFIVVTDHNVWVGGIEGYYGPSQQHQVLLLVGEEIHDVRRDPQTNHMLVYGADRELAQYASNPQDLIEQVGEGGGTCYLAHPIDKAAPLFNEPAIPWVNWDIEGYAGIELWNYMAEFKRFLSGKVKAVRLAYNPEKAISGPFPETLALWDHLLGEGRDVRVIGCADAHANRYSIGPLARVVFPYEYLFRCVNTHILTSRPFNGDFEHDKRLALNALRAGSAFVGYDLPAPTRGFRFSAQGHNTSAIMGGRIRLGHGVTLQIAAPHIAEIRLLKDGETVLHEPDGTHCVYIANKPGIYRVEVYIRFKGKQRGWIFSNPIFIVT
jgi:hypothetical protein